MFRKQLYILLGLVLFLIPALGFAQATTVNLGTSSSGVVSVSFNTWTKVDPNISITANGTISGFRFKYLKPIQVVQAEIN